MHRHRIDNQYAGTSKLTTKCQCFNGATPMAEACNGIDDDCDGQVDEGCEVPLCHEGEIGSDCLCGGSRRSSGYCCSDTYSSSECVNDYTWIILIIAGVAILVVLAALIMIFRREGKELTWNELSRKYGS